MRYRVTTCALDLTGPSPVFVEMADGTTTRDEIIDTETNILFRGCKGPWDVLEMVEAFWNRLNDPEEYEPNNCHSRHARVVVLNVTPTTQPEG